MHSNSLSEGSILQRRASDLRVWAAWSMLAMLGCSPTGVAPVPARGVVKTKSGTPCEGALVVFHPQEKGRVNDPKPVATADASGNFVLTTMALNDGAVPGDYGVTVVWPSKSNGERELSLSGEGGGGGADQLGGRYGDPRTPAIKLTIPAQGNTDIQLQVE
ncbi:MAG: hypothetical protein ACK5OB_17925 [Pirellula sp.]